MNALNLNLNVNAPELTSLSPEESVRKNLSALEGAGNLRLEREMYYGKAVARLRGTLNDPSTLYKTLDRLGLNIIGEASDIKTSRYKMNANEITTYIWLFENWEQLQKFRSKGLTKATAGPSLRRDWRNWVDKMYSKGSRHSSIISQEEWEMAEDRKRLSRQRAQSREENAAELIVKKFKGLKRERKREVLKALRGLV